MKKVINGYGKEVDYELAVSFMDDDLREELHSELAPCSDQTFFDAYTKRHEEAFGEEWIAASENPVW